MDNNEITFINSDDEFEPIKYKEPINNNGNNKDDDTVSVPDWDLTPPFDSLDRGDMK